MDTFSTCESVSDGEWVFAWTTVVPRESFCCQCTQTPSKLQTFVNMKGIIRATFFPSGDEMA